MQFSLWNTPERIVDIAEAIGYYYVFSDTENNLHLIWSTALNSTYKIQYRKINPRIFNHNPHNRIIILATSKHIYLQPVIYEVDKKILAIWKDNGIFYGCDIDQSGLSHGNEFPIPYSDHGVPVLVEYKSNFEFEKGNFNGHLLYGITGDYIDLILAKNFTCDFLDALPDEAKEENQKMFYNEENPLTKDITNHFVEDVSANSNLVKKTDTQDKITVDNKTLVNPLDNNIGETNNEQLIKILEEIKTQNSLLIKSLNITFDGNIANKKRQKVNIFKKIARIFWQS
jgi:hypothetical protein